MLHSVLLADGAPPKDGARLEAGALLEAGARIYDRGIRAMSNGNCGSGN